MHYGTKPSHFETSKIHFPTSEGVSEVSGASERANGRASGPVLTSRFLFVPDHSASVTMAPLTTLRDKRKTNRLYTRLRKSFSDGSLVRPWRDSNGSTTTTRWATGSRSSSTTHWATGSGLSSTKSWATGSRSSSTVRFKLRLSRSSWTPIIAWVLLLIVLDVRSNGDDVSQSIYR